MKRCRECRKLFTPVRTWQLFCSVVCRKLWYLQLYRAARATGKVKV